MARPQQGNSPMSNPKYSIEIYNHRVRWFWRIVDENGMTVQDMDGTIGYDFAGECAREAMAAECHWIATGRQWNGNKTAA
jgi:hypothetical protein